MKEIVDVISNFGVTIAMLAYMVFKDYNLNNRLIECMTKNTETLELLKNIILGGAHNE